MHAKVASPRASRVREGADLLIGIDSGTSVVKAVAFDLAGRQIASAAVLNRYDTGADGVGDPAAGADLGRLRAGDSRPRREGRRVWRGAPRRSR